MFEGLLNKVEISEAAIYGISSRLLETLLIDRTTGENILWCTDDYAERGEGYTAKNHITVEQVISEEIIQPRIFKSLEAQKNRVKEKGEVFTPAWLCNLMNNAIDDEWLGYKEAFSSSGQGKWTVNKEKIKFPQQGKTQPKGWQGYVKSRRLELTCGEAPFLVSRYDMADGRMIPVNERIGLLDRKLRVINEHIRNLRAKRENAKEKWLSWAMKAVRNTYGYEWQGDNVLLARENILLDVMEFYQDKWQEEMPIDWVHKFAEVISWNIWQMDGLKLVVPGTCHEEIIEKQIQSMTLFEKEKITAKDIKCQENFLKNDETVTVQNCPGCRNEDISMHNGIPCKIKNWSTGEVIEFRSCLCEYWEGAEKMGKKPFRPDVIVGNPPYQDSISTGDNLSLSKQLFPSFVQNSILLGSKYVLLVTPSRWFTADAQDKSFVKLREFMKEHQHISKIFHYPDGRQVFPGVTVGSVSYFLYDKDYNGLVEFNECGNGYQNQTLRPLFEENLDIILYMNEMIGILDKVRKHEDFVSLTTITYGRNAFGVVGKASTLEAMSKDKAFEGSVAIHCAHEEIRYTQRENITKNIDLIDKWKIFTSKGNGGAGTLNKEKAVAILGKAFVGKPNYVCTDSLIPMGPLDTEIEAVNLQKYMSTKFLRFMVGILKVSQNLYQTVYQFVPMQNFTANSDINWNVDVSLIDQQLYDKYKFSDEEKFFIENMVKPMEEVNNA